MNLASRLLGMVAIALVVGVSDGVAQRKPKSSTAIDSLEPKAKADSNDALLLLITHDADIRAALNEFPRLPELLRTGQDTR